MQPCAKRLQAETESTPWVEGDLVLPLPCVCRNHGRNSKGSCAVFEPARSVADLRRIKWCSTGFERDNGTRVQF
jgi:hypothetical protein